jgi:hypothetical protein
MKNSVIPGFEMKATLSFGTDEIVVNIWGELLSEDGKSLSEIHLKEYSNPQNGIPLTFKKPAVYLSDAEKSRYSTSLTVTLISYLNEKIIDYIETLREKNAKKDVRLTLKINISYLTVDLRVGEYNSTRISPTNPANAVTIAAPKTKDPNNAALRLLVAPNYGGDSVFTSVILQISLWRTVAASDWVSDFQEQLGIGKHLVVEIPIPMIEAPFSESKKFTEDEKRLVERLKGAYKTLEEMRNFLKGGEWDKVVEESFKLFEILKKDNTALIKEMLKQTTGVMDKEAVEFTIALENLYGYAAGLHHPVNKDEKSVKGSFTGAKEDAYMFYLLSVSLVNLISAKLRKMGD